MTHFIEIGPHPVLLGMGAQCLPGAGPAWLPSLHRDRSDWRDLLESLQRLYVDGAAVDWAAFDRGYSRPRVSLPTYPFRRRRHWMEVIRRSRAETGIVWADLVDALDRQSLQAPLDLDAASYPEKWRVLSRVTMAHSNRILSRCGSVPDGRAKGERTMRSSKLPRLADHIGI